MLDACAPRARWIDAFCERGRVRRRPVPGRARGRPRRAGLGLRLHANQLGPGPGVQLAVELGAASADHCTYLTDADIDALAGEHDRRHVPARPPTSPPASPTPTPAGLIDAGATVALATNCNPGSSYTTSMPFCIALAVRDLHMTVDEALWAATAGGAAALRRADVGRLAPGSGRGRHPRRAVRTTTSSTAPACRSWPRSSPPDRGPDLRGP